MVILAALAAGLAATALLKPTPSAFARSPTPPPAGQSTAGWMHRYRLVWAAGGGLAGATFFGGEIGPLAGLGAALAVWIVIGRSEPPAAIKRRILVRRELPQLVALMDSGVRSGLPTAEALSLACAALPGPAAETLRLLPDRIQLGIDPVEVWSSLLDDPALAPLGRALRTSHETGTAIGPTLRQLADELADRAQAEAEQAAHSVGVRAALPLGLCLLPSFILLGIVPLVAGLIGSLSW